MLLDDLIPDDFHIKGLFCKRVRVCVYTCVRVDVRVGVRVRVRVRVGVRVRVRERSSVAKKISNHMYCKSQ